MSLLNYMLNFLLLRGSTPIRYLYVGKRKEQAVICSYASNLKVAKRMLEEGSFNRIILGEPESDFDYSNHYQLIGPQPTIIVSIGDKEVKEDLVKLADSLFRKYEKNFSSYLRMESTRSLPYKFPEKFTKTIGLLLLPMSLMSLVGVITMFTGFEQTLISIIVGAGFLVLSLGANAYFLRMFLGKEISHVERIIPPLVFRLLAILYVLVPIYEQLTRLFGGTSSLGLFEFFICIGIAGLFYFISNRIPEAE